MKIRSAERRQASVQPSTYYGSALFVVFSLTILGTAYFLQDMRVFAASFAVGAAIIAIMCYVAIVSTVKERAKRADDVGSPCAYASNVEVGVCPDTHDEQEGVCKLRKTPLDIGGDRYQLSKSADVDASYLKMHDLNGMDTENLSNLCGVFENRPYTALNTMGSVCVRS